MATKGTVEGLLAGLVCKEKGSTNQPAIACSTALLNMLLEPAAQAEALALNGVPQIAALLQTEDMTLIVRGLGMLLVILGAAYAHNLCRWLK